MSDIKESMIQAVIDLLEDGFELDELTVRRIAYEAHVATGLIHYHFGSKDKLIVQAISKIVDRAAKAKFAALSSSHDTPRDQLVKFLQALTSIMLEYRTYSRVIIRDELLSDRFSTPEVILPLLSQIRPDLSPEALKLLSIQIVSTFQYLYLKESGFKEFMAMETIDYDALIEDVLSSLID